MVYMHHNINNITDGVCRVLNGGWRRFWWVTVLFLMVVVVLPL